jgi:hypothetical protein
MFTSRNTKETLATIDLIKSLSGLVAGMKGGSTERLEAMAMNVAALGISPETIGQVEINWRTINVGGSEELVPVMRMVSRGGEFKELEQLEKKA